LHVQDYIFPKKNLKYDYFLCFTPTWELQIFPLHWTVHNFYLMMLQGNTKVELYIFYVYILKSELLSYEFRDQTWSPSYADFLVITKMEISSTTISCIKDVIVEIEIKRCRLATCYTKVLSSAWLTTWPVLNSIILGLYSFT